jgi:hypothetical protein
MCNTYKILVRKLEGKSSLGRPRHGWEELIKVDIIEIWYETTDQINMAQVRVHI